MSTDARRRSSGRNAAIRIVQALVALTLLILLWRLADGPEAARILASADPWWLVLAVVLLLGNTVLGALRWRATAAPLGIAISRAEAVREYFLAQLVNSALPGGVLGDAGRATRSRHHAGLGPAAGAVIIERSIGQLAMLATLGAGFAITLAVPGGLDWPTGLATAVATALSAFWGLVLLLALGARRVRPLPGSRLDRIVDGLRRCLAEPGVARRQTALSAGTTFCILTAFACCAAAVGAPLSSAAAVAVVPLVLFAMLLPISIAGWGVREGAALALLPVAGLTEAEALAASVAFGLTALVSTLPGFFAIWGNRRAERVEIVAGSEDVRMQHPSPAAGPEESS